MIRAVAVIEVLAHAADEHDLIRPWLVCKRREELESGGLPERGIDHRVGHPVDRQGHVARADADRADAGDLPTIAERQLRRATADIEDEDGPADRARHRDATRAVRGEDRLEVVPRGRAHEDAALCGEQLVDGPRVRALQGHAGEDHRARVDLGWREARGRVGVPDETIEGRGVDEPVADRRVDDRGPADHTALDEDVTARVRIGQALQTETRQHDVRRRGPDVDAHRGEDDVVRLELLGRQVGMNSRIREETPFFRSSSSYVRMIRGSSSSYSICRPPSFTLTSMPVKVLRLSARVGYRKPPNATAR